MTPTQERFLALLADGLAHDRLELHALLWDEQGALSNIKPHLTHLRKVLRPLGETVICERHVTVRYRRVTLLEGNRKR